MVVKYLGDNQYQGLAADTKPVAANTAVNAIFRETDTYNEYINNGTTWILYRPPYFLLIQGGVASSYATNQITHYSCFGGTQNATTETLMQATFPYALRVKRMIVKFATNTKDAATVVKLRDDAADVTGCTITIPAGSTAEVDSGPIDAAIAAMSKVNWRVDTSTSTTGNIIWNHMYAVAAAITLV